MLLFKYALREIKILLKYLILIGITLLFLFSSLGVLASVVINLKSEFEINYGYTYISTNNLSCENLKDIINEYNDDVALYSVKFVPNISAFSANNNQIEMPYYRYYIHEYNSFDKELITESKLNEIFINNTDVSVASLDGIKKQLNKDGFLYLSDIIIECEQKNNIYAKLNDSFFIINNLNCNTVFNYNGNIVLSQDLADSLLVKVGDIIDVICTDGRIVSACVFGIVDSDSFDYEYVVDYSMIDILNTQNDVIDVILQFKNKDLFSKIYNQIYSFDINLAYDKEYEEMSHYVNLLVVVVAFLCLAIYIILTIVLYSFSKLIILKRRMAIFRLKLLGASDKAVAMLYVTVVTPIVCLSFIAGIIMSYISINKLKDLYFLLFNETINFQLNWLLLVSLLFFYITSFYYIIYKNLGKKNSKITYSLIKNKLTQ